MTYRVVQWATGAMGKTCLRSIIDHPGLELAGLYVYSKDKVGKDAGEICHRPDTGVIATQSVDEILALDADVVIHTPRLQPPYHHHNDDICRLLASGKNVISINGHSYPQYWGEEYIQAINNACQQGHSTLFGTGLNPGFIVEKIATTATGICSQLDTITVTETVECQVMRSPNYVFDILGFGSQIGQINPNNLEWPPAEMLNGMFSEVVAAMIKRLGFKLETIKTDHRMLPASTDIETAAGTIKKGTVSHTNWRWLGIVDGQTRYTHSIHWIMETTHLPNKNYNLWDISIKGTPGVEININLTEPDGHQYKTTPEQYGVAASVINSISSVCQAPAGVMQIPVANHFVNPHC